MVCLFSYHSVHWFILHSKMIVNVQAQIVNCDCECAGIALTLGWILTLALTPVCQRSLFTISKFLIDRTLFRYGISFSLQISKLELFGLFSDTEYPFFTISKFELVGLFSDTEYPFFLLFQILNCLDTLQIRNTLFLPFKIV